MSEEKSPPSFSLPFKPQKQDLAYKIQYNLCESLINDFLTHNQTGYLLKLANEKSKNKKTNHK